MCNEYQTAVLSHFESTQLLRLSQIKVQRQAWPHGWRVGIAEFDETGLGDCLGSHDPSPFGLSIRRLVVFDIRSFVGLWVIGLYFFLSFSVFLAGSEGGGSSQLLLLLTPGLILFFTGQLLCRLFHVSERESQRLVVFVPLIMPLFTLPILTFIGWVCFLLLSCRLISMK